uniref:Uncharacterized protein n=1 Tax=Anguilla anguilla TaxID=7936 RepID=A0A0E9V4E6_ANGAN
MFLSGHVSLLNSTRSTEFQCSFLINVIILRTTNTAANII